MHTALETFLASIHALHQLEPKNLPSPIVQAMVKMSPEELFKTCSQLAVLRHNIPSHDKTITLTDAQIAKLAEEYLQELVRLLK